MTFVYFQTDAEIQNCFIYDYLYTLNKTAMCFYNTQSQFIIVLIGLSTNSHKSSAQEINTQIYEMLFVYHVPVVNYFIPKDA